MGGRLQRFSDVVHRTCRKSEDPCLGRTCWWSLGHFLHGRCQPPRSPRRNPESCTVGRGGQHPVGCESLTTVARTFDPEAPVWRGDTQLAPHQQGIIVLGSLVGKEAFITVQLSTKREERQVLLDRIPCVSDVQTAWLLLLSQNRWGIGRVHISHVPPRREGLCSGLGRCWASNFHRGLHWQTELACCLCEGMWRTSPIMGGNAKSNTSETRG